MDRIAVIAAPRTGSTMVCDVLNEHNKLAYPNYRSVSHYELVSEPILPCRRNDGTYFTPHLDDDGNIVFEDIEIDVRCTHSEYFRRIDMLYEMFNKNRYPVLKVNSNTDISFAHMLKEHGYSFVHVYRKSLYYQLLSFAVSLHTGIWMRENIEVSRGEITIDKSLFYSLKRLNVRAFSLANLFGARLIAYEDICDKKEEILSWCPIIESPLRDYSFLSEKQNGTDIEDWFSNLEEIKEWCQ